MSNTKKWNINIDVIKCLAIISVILLHTYQGKFLLQIGAPLHIWQAVPVFIILQGFNNAGSYQRRDFKSLADFKDLSYMWRKMKRLLFPFIIFFIVQIIFLRLDTPEYFASENILFRLFTGGRGPGSYFIPLTIQAQLILPLLYLVARKSVKGLLVGSFIVTTILEYLSFAFDMHEELYQIIIIRFIFALALGVALSILGEDKFKNRLFYGLVVVSAIYIIGVMYFDWHFIMEHFWHSQHVPGFFWPLFLILVLNGVKMSEENKIIQTMAKLGQASYHIFFVQILYFWAPINEMRPDTNLFVGTIVNVFICGILGIGFYKLEQIFWNKIEN